MKQLNKWLATKLGYLKDNNAAAYSVDSDIFTQWFIYNFMHDDASMARCEKGFWQKSTYWSELCLDIDINLPFTRSRKSKDVEILGAEI